MTSSCIIIRDLSVINTEEQKMMMISSSTPSSYSSVWSSQHDIPSSRHRRRSYQGWLLLLVVTAAAAAVSLSNQYFNRRAQVMLTQIYDLVATRRHQEAWLETLQKKQATIVDNDMKHSVTVENAYRTRVQRDAQREHVAEQNEQAIEAKLQVDEENLEEIQKLIDQTDQVRHELLQHYQQDKQVRDDALDRLRSKKCSWIILQSFFCSKQDDEKIIQQSMFRLQRDAILVNQETRTEIMERVVLQDLQNVTLVRDKQRLTRAQAVVNWWDHQWQQDLAKEKSWNVTLNRLRGELQYIENAEHGVNRTIARESETIQTLWHEHDQLVTSSRILTMLSMVLCLLSSWLIMWFAVLLGVRLVQEILEPRNSGVAAWLPKAIMMNMVIFVFVMNFQEEVLNGGGIFLWSVVIRASFAAFLQGILALHLQTDASGSLETNRARAGELIVVRFLSYFVLFTIEALWMWLAGPQVRSAFLGRRTWFVYLVAIGLLVLLVSKRFTSHRNVKLLVTKPLETSPLMESESTIDEESGVNFRGNFLDSFDVYRSEHLDPSLLEVKAIALFAMAFVEFGLFVMIVTCVHVLGMGALLFVATFLFLGARMQPFLSELAPV